MVGDLRSCANIRNHGLTSPRGALSNLNARKPIYDSLPIPYICHANINVVFVTVLSRIPCPSCWLRCQVDFLSERIVKFASSGFILFHIIAMTDEPSASKPDWLCFTLPGAGSNDTTTVTLHRVRFRICSTASRSLIDPCAWCCSRAEKQKDVNDSQKLNGGRHCSHFERFGTFW